MRSNATGIRIATRDDAATVTDVITVLSAPIRYGAGRFPILCTGSSA